jgi:hypothetical protein
VEVNVVLIPIEVEVEVQQIKDEKDLVVGIGPFGLYVFNIPTYVISEQRLQEEIFKALVSTGVKGNIAVVVCSAPLKAEDHPVLEKEIERLLQGKMSLQDLTVLALNFKLKVKEE